MQLLLLILQVIIVAVLFMRMFGKDKIKSVFFLGIFFYTIFTEINCVYFPDFIDQYVSNSSELFLEFYVFNSLSLISFYVFFEFFERVPRRIVIHVYKKKTHYSRVAIYCYSLLMIVSLAIIIINWNSMSYINNVQRNFGAGVAFARYLNDLNVYYLMIVLSALQYTEKKTEKRLLLMSSLLCFIDLALFNFINGNRAVVASVLMGIFILFFYEKRLSFSLLVKMLAIGLVGIIYMIIARSARNLVSVQTQGAVKTLLQDDYAYPAITIIGVMRFSLINPIKVITSFLSEATGLFSGVYLYETVYETAFPQFIAQAAVYDTNPGIGLHIFTEGFVFAGIVGFLYNGIVLNIHTRIWEMLANTNDKQTNKAFSAIITGVFFLMVRGETVYFFKNVVLLLIPAIVMFLFICNKSISVCLTGSVRTRQR